MIERIGKHPEGGEVVTQDAVKAFLRKVGRQRVLDAAISMAEKNSLS